MHIKKNNWRVKWQRSLPFGLIFSLLLARPAETVALPNDPPALLRFADHLYDHRDFAASITEYWRFLCFHPTHVYTFYAYYKAGTAHAELQEWDAAANLLRRALQSEAPESLRVRIRYQLAFTLMAKGDFELARLELFKLTRGNPANAVTDASAWLYGLLLVQLGHWREAQTVFALLRQRADTTAEWRPRLTRIDALLQQLVMEPKKKSPRTAKWLSTFIPGSGQIYAGRFWNGLNALALNAGTSYLTWQAHEEGRERDLVLLFSFLWSRYYFGNRLHAEEAAVRFNQKYQQNLVEQIYELIRQASLYNANTPLTVGWQQLKTLQK